MRKTLLLIFILLISAILISCSSEKFSDSVIVEPEKGEPEMEISTLVDNIHKIIIVDPCDQMFEPNLKYQLSEEESKELLSLLVSWQKKKENAGGYYLYAFQFLDADGNELERIMVDCFDSLETTTDGCFVRTDILNEFLCGIESKYELSTDLWNRKPGVNYFGLLEKADRGTFEEITDNNFIQGLQCNLEKEDFQALLNMEEEFNVSEVPLDMFDKKYKIEVYGEGGAGLYTLFQDSNGKCFTDSGYEILSDSISAWINVLRQRVKS